MTLPVSGSPVTNNYTFLWNAIVTLKSNCLRIQEDIGAGSCSLQWFLQLAKDTLQFNATYAQCTATQPLADGIVAWAQQQAPGVTFSATDFVNTYNAAQTILSAITAQYPTTGGFLADRTWNGTTGEIWATTTAEQVPTIMSAISGFLATLS